MINNNNFRLNKTSLNLVILNMKFDKISRLLLTSTFISIVHPLLVTRSTTAKIGFRGHGSNNENRLLCFVDKNYIYMSKEIRLGDDNIFTRNNVKLCKCPDHNRSSCSRNMLQREMVTLIQ